MTSWSECPVCGKRAGWGAGGPQRFRATFELPRVFVHEDCFQRVYAPKVVAR